MRNEILNEIKESIKVKENIINSTKLLDDIKNLAEEIIKTLKNNGKIIFFGNGGSFADAQHLTAEFISKLRVDRNAIPALALGTNSSNLTAIANDYGYENIFKRQIESIANDNDIIFAFSTSGNSPNVLEALKYVKEDFNKNIISILFTGNKKGKAEKYANYVIDIPSSNTARIQEMHIMIGHIICEFVDESF